MLLPFPMHTPPSGSSTATLTPDLSQDLGSCNNQPTVRSPLIGQREPIEAWNSCFTSLKSGQSGEPQTPPPFAGKQTLTPHAILAQ